MARPKIRCNECVIGKVDVTEQLTIDKCKACDTGSNFQPSTTGFRIVHPATYDDRAWAKPLNKGVDPYLVYSPTKNMAWGRTSF